MIKPIVAAAILAAAAFGASMPTQAASPPDMLVIGTNLTGLRTLDPAGNNSRISFEIVANLYDNLVQLPQEDLTRIEPMLATAWSVSEDGTTVTMTLRDDVVFDSGNPLTAEDAAWSIRRVVQLGQVGGTDLTGLGYTEDNVEDLVNATGPHTLTIGLPDDVNADLLLYALAAASVGILDKETVLAHADGDDMGSNWLVSNTAGSGPFALADLRPNDIVLFRAKDDYWGGELALNRVAMRHIPESGNLRLQVQAGDVDIGMGLLEGDFNALASDARVEVRSVPTFGFWYMALNAQDPLLSDPLVRRAFQHAVDWRGLSDTLMKYDNFPWQSVIPRDLPGAPAEATDRFTYDPELARSLLAEAGHPDGIQVTLYTGGSGGALAVGEAVQSSALAAGIDFDLIPGAWLPQYRTRDFQVMLATNGAKLPDPSSVLTQVAYNPDNSDEAMLTGLHMWRTAMSVPEINELIEESYREADPARRAEIFSRIDQIYRDMDPSLIIFFQRTDPYVIRTNVQGYEPNSTWTTRWQGVWKE